MSEQKLKTISIDLLEPGMYVQSIAKQKGGLQVKAQGRVNSSNAIAALKKKGVAEVIIDESKCASTPKDQSEQQTESSHPQKATPTSMAIELETAKKLHKQGKKLQSDLINAVQKGLPFDDKIPRGFTNKMVGSIQRNPNALLCLSRIKEKDDYLLEHSLNVAILLANFGQFCGMEQHAIEELAHAGFLHDLGKILVPDEILHKPGRLTDDEMAIMQQHVTYGVDALNEASVDPRLVRIVSEHHERLDGKGYPLGKGADDISHEGRMLAIADMYDALTADRCYKPGMSSQKALRILLDEAPERIDSTLVQHFIRCMGVYPVGSLVKLSNDRLGLVIKQNDQNPLAPVVKVFYSASGQHYIEQKVVDVAKEQSITIVEAVIASDYKLDFNAYFHESIAID